MKLEEIKTPVSALTGVGEVSAKLLAKLNIFTVGDLLKFYPKSYEDRTKHVPIAGFENARINTAVQVTAHQWFGYGKMKTLKIIVSDGVSSAALIAFNRQFLEHSLPPGTIAFVNGEFSVKYGQIQSSSFDILKLAESGNIEEYKNKPVPCAKILPVYHLTEGLNQKNMRKYILSAVNGYLYGIENEIPENIIKERKLLSKQTAVALIHQPKTLECIKNAQQTLIYEELFKFQCIIAARIWKYKGFLPCSASKINNTVFSQLPSQNNKKNSFEVDISPLQKMLLEKLPFALTDDQKNVISSINYDIDLGYKDRSRIMNGNFSGKNPFTMTRLLQGDVGSGKTLVVFFACLRIINWKGQCAIMAPTELLAKQHADAAAELLAPLGISIAFLTGNVKAAGRKQLLKALKDGEIDIVIGTHALFSQQTIYKDLQLAVIDEQHRFGVIQRQSIIDKGRKAENGIFFEPHLLMMSATPIPQTLALTAFGDLDISVIKTMPKGRKPVKTYLVKEGNEKNAYEAVREHLKKGKQAYFVYPAIDSDNPNFQIKSAEEMFKILSEKIFPEYKCALVHSKTIQASDILSGFRKGDIQILAATTVIEVGVDVPNAVCIVIEQADRFGLAQLHQLRGRVGRGKEQSFCFLIYSKNISESGIERMKILRHSTDGFIIAEQDLKLRGPGEITGTVQAGNFTLGIADPIRDNSILLNARSDAFKFMHNKLQDGAF